MLIPFQMPGGVTVKDVNQQEFVRALAAFLKKSVHLYLCSVMIDHALIQKSAFEAS